MRKNYATSLCKEYLQYLGITHVSEDGKEIYKNGKLIKQCNDGRYNLIELYDPIIRQAVPKEKRTNSSGQFALGTHRIVYTWYKGFIPEGLIVDHINGNKSDNHINNLQLLTPQQNLFKARENKKMKVYLLPKNKQYSVEEVERLLDECITNYEEAKQNHDAKLAHKLRSYKVKYESWLIQLKKNLKANQF